MYSGNPDRRPAAPVTVSRLQRMKTEGKPIASLTAYDYSLARVTDAAGVDFVLVGDSLGNVVQGRSTTIPVTVDDIVYHTRCVVPACRRALVVADMPFLSYTHERDALACAARLMKEGGAQMVKLEGAGDQTGIVAALARAGVPVCAHLGLQPQLVHKMGGYRVQGRDEADAEALLQEARRLEEAGADVLLVECIPATLGERLAGALGIPVIGIGAGVGCDGQILVVQDVLGITPGRPPRFARDFLADGGSIAGAIGAYVDAVRERRFPTPEHSF